MSSIEITIALDYQFPSLPNSPVKEGYSSLADSFLDAYEGDPPGISVRCEGSHGDLYETDVYVWYLNQKSSKKDDWELWFAEYGAEYVWGILLVEGETFLVHGSVNQTYTILEDFSGVATINLGWVGNTDEPIPNEPTFFEPSPSEEPLSEEPTTPPPTEHPLETEPTETVSGKAENYDTMVLFVATSLLVIIAIVSYRLKLFHKLFKRYDKTVV